MTTDTSNLHLAQAVILGNILERPDRAALAFATCPVSTFDGQYRVVAEAIHRLRVNRQTVSLLSVLDELGRTGQLGRAGGPSEVTALTLHSFGDLEYACGMWARETRRRNLLAATLRAAQDLENDHHEPEAIAAHLRSTVEDTIAGANTEDVVVPNVDEYLDGEDDPYRWVIPGLLEETDRFVLTGSEGLGKSVLGRQLAVCAAAGIHPFTGERFPPQRVLIIDCENSRSQIRRNLRGMVMQAKRMTGLETIPLFVIGHPSGLDLQSDRDAAEFLAPLAVLQPHLLITGPLYRLHTGPPNDEETARNVTITLDRARAISQCALVLEAHAGHGDGSGGKRPVRPAGSSLWLRWPEFGYGMRLAPKSLPGQRLVKIDAWRGPRDERSWPEYLEAGGIWPWRSVSPGSIQSVPVDDPPEDRWPTPYKD